MTFVGHIKTPQDRLEAFVVSFFILEYVEFGNEIIQDRRDRDQDRFDDLDIDMQLVDKDEHDQCFKQQGKDPGGCEFDQFIQETVVGPIEIEISEQDKGNEGGQDPGDDIGDCTV